MSDTLAKIGLSVIRKITDLWAGAKAESLIDYTQVARVEPIVLIDADCLYLDALSDVQQSLLSIFAGYYLQAVAISTTVGNIEVRHHLDKLNPRRSPTDSAANTMGWLLAAEAYNDRLPIPDDPRFALESVALEAKHSSTSGKTPEEMRKERHERELSRGVSSPTGMSYDRETTSELKELANLSVGKMLNVEITDGKHTAMIPIAIRLMASSLPSASLVHILSINGQNLNTAKERYHAWRSGRLEFVKDLILCQDLIDAHRKELMHDAQGTYTGILKRNRANQLSTIVSGNPSVAKASNIVIVSNDTLADLELHLDGKISDFKTREKVLKETSLMIFCVIDKQWERCTFYYRGINGATEVGVKDLKNANKGSGPNISDILKAYQIGNSPSL
jgi:hypothetical protein